jgi:hypothetical protein
MGNQVNGTIVTIQNFLADMIGIMTEKVAIDVETGNGFDIRRNHTQVMRYQDDGHLLIQFLQNLIKILGKAFIYKGIRFI